MMNQQFPCLLVLGNDPEDQSYHYIRNEDGLYDAALEILSDRYGCDWYPFPSFFMLEEDTERALTSLFIDAGYTRKQAENELREPCHHWVRTLALPVTKGTLGAALPHRPPAAWDASDMAADTASAREVWDDIEDDLKKRVTALATERTKDLGARLDSARELVEKSEKDRFDKRRKELEKAMADNQLAKLQKEVQEYLERRQLFLFTDLDEDERKKLSNLQAEIELRKKHYDLVLAKLKDEETRTLNLVLPHRYRLRGEARVYPIAVEILLPTNEQKERRA